MGHPDNRIEHMLTSLGALSAARRAASSLFTSWSEMAEFFVTVFSNTPASLIVGLDVARGDLSASYDFDGESVSTMAVLALAAESGGTLSEDRERIAAVFRALTFQSPPALTSMSVKDVSQLWEDLRYTTFEQLEAYDSYDITDRGDRWNVFQMFATHRLPVQYVRDISHMRARYADGVKALYSVGVPANYAVEVANSLQDDCYPEGLDKDSFWSQASTAKAIGRMYKRLSMAIGGSSSSMAVSWHIAALYLENVPASYARAGAGRFVADIVRLEEAGVAEDYVRAVGPSAPVADVLRAFSDGIPAEYLREVVRTSIS